MMLHGLTLLNHFSAWNVFVQSVWRSGVRSAMCAASQLSGSGPTDVDVAPVLAS